MKISRSSLLFIVLGLCLVACSAAKSVETAEQGKPVPLGEYKYTGFDKSGKRIVEGRLSITAVKGKQIEGDWELKEIDNPGRIGPQVGSGALVGSVDEQKVYINLNPNISDANVFLNGTNESGSYKGTWSFSGIAGPISQGTFEAVKK